MELIRTVWIRPYPKGEGPIFRLLLFYKGTEKLSYDFDMLEAGKKTELFNGDEYRPSPLHAVDSDESVLGLLHFLTLRPGDTDDEYFKNYTPVQLDYCVKHAEAVYAEARSRFTKEAHN